MNTLLSAHYILRYFTPIQVFMTPYLIQVKRFTNHEVSNLIYPCFFISTFVTSIIGMFIVGIIGNKNTLILDTFIELVGYLVCFCAPARHFRKIQCFAILRGMSSALGILAKGVLYTPNSNAGDRSDRYSQYNLIKKNAGVLASWIGQELVFGTGTHQTNLYFSILSTILAFILALFISDKTGIKKENVIRFNFLELVTKLKKIYTKKIILFSLLNISASSLYVCFSIYSSNVFQDRRKSSSSFVMGKLLYYISYPLREFGRFFIYLIGAFDPAIQYSPKYDEKILIHGYINGLSRLCSAVLAHFIRYKKNELRETICLTLGVIFILMIFTYLLGCNFSLFNSYLIYICGYTLGLSGLILSHGGLNEKTDILHIILGINLCIDSLIHIGISYYTKKNCTTVSRKVYYYFCVNTVLLGCACALSFSILKN
ncbi:hypothetical protein TCON_1394 [Astathelohania contejeani]|uniref:Uncharacterized protein n=1 Tax=Astathelohania contejeani TaxID=164912 RepID=A0ABQ7HYY1_9MICR|nr:hypothetical protein TCON_1394 [Thelohania contejeani]